MADKIPVDRKALAALLQCLESTALPWRGWEAFNKLYAALELPYYKDDMEPEKSQRGFARIEFEDANGYACSLLESSSCEPAIWLGRRYNQVPHSVTGEALSPLMYLTVEQVKTLLPYLNRFAETGEIQAE